MDAVAVAAATSDLWEALQKNDLDRAADALQRGADVHARDRAAFRWACADGRLEAAQWLLGLSAAHAVNVHAMNEDALVTACHYNRGDIVRLLLSLGGSRAVDVHVSNDAPFRRACDAHADRVLPHLLALTGPRAIPSRLVQRMGTQKVAHTCVCRPKTCVIQLFLELRGDRAIDLDPRTLPFICAQGVSETQLVLARYPSLPPLTQTITVRKALEWGQTDVVSFLLSLRGARAMAAQAVVESGISSERDARRWRSRRRFMHN